MHNILVTGANGQLGQCIKERYTSRISRTDFNFVFVGRDDVDVTDIDSVENALSSIDYEYLINCAAYTNVNGAESNEEDANKLNGDACMILANACARHNIKFIHISTDYVFNGAPEVKYETSDTSPLQVYGESKLAGEEQIKMVDEILGLDYMIIRTSWLYSKYGNNFMKTMINKFHEMNTTEIKVVCDQVGSPTSAHDLATFIISQVVIPCSFGLKEFKKGIYHYSNEGIVSWFDFAKSIYDIASEYDDLKIVTIIPCDSQEWESPCTRPSCSILSKNKVKQTYNVEIPYWRSSLRTVIEKYYNVYE